jgi:hypothetical protein
MKRLQKAMIVALLTVPFALYANGGQEKSAAKSSGGAAAPAAAATTGKTKSGLSMDSLKFATIQVGTADYTISVGIGQMWQKAIPGLQVDVQPISPGGMGAPYLFANHQCDIAFTNGAPANWAWNTGVLGRPPVQDCLGLAGGTNSILVVQFLTNSFMK